MSKHAETLQEPVGQAFQIIKTDSFSLYDLMRLQQQGETIVRTPHNGNWSIPNMVYAQAGLRAVIYDRNFGDADGNYHPHTLIHDGVREEIGHPEILTSHARITATPNSFPRAYARAGEHLHRMHQSALEEAFTGVNLMQYSDYLRQHKELVDTILQACIDTKPELWKRYVDEHGLVHILGPKGEDEKGNDHLKDEIAHPSHIQEVFAIHNDEQGWLIPNTINILLMGVLEAISYKTNRVYHVSGPDMIHYIDEMQPDLDNLYQAVRKHLQGKVDLPEKLEFYLIPLASIRLATTNDNRAALDQMINSQLAYEEEQHSRPERLRAVGGFETKEGKEFLAEFKQRTDKLTSQIIEAVSACPEIFYTLEDGTYLSQYDVLKRGGLYVPEWVVHAPISEVTRLYTIFKKIRNKELARQGRLQQNQS